jgi:hypothetical protein
MSTTTLRTTVTRLAVVAAAVAGLAFAAAPADAAIGKPQGKLTITPFKPRYHNFAVFGHVPMSRAEAQGLIDSGHKIQLRLWGDDQWSDDLIYGPYPATYYASSKGLEFHKVILGFPDSRLNEDWGMDELYVGMRLTNPDGGTLRSGETNRWYAFF